MRSNALIFLIVFYLSSGIHLCNGQKVDNKLNISAGLQIGMFHGDKQIKEGNFIYPAFYRNLTYSNGLSFKAVYKGGKFISYGIGLNSSNASGWRFNGMRAYTTASVRMNSFAPTLQFHNEYSHKGLFNRGKLFVELSPVIGVSNFTTSDEIFSVEDLDAVSTPTESNDLFYGFKGSAGLEWALTQTTGLVLSYSLHQNRISSILYSERHFTGSQLNIGFVFKLMKDKRFLYKN